MGCFQSLCLISGVLSQGGGVFGTFVSSFFLQFSQDGRQWYTYKELGADAQPRAKVSQTHPSDILFLFWYSMVCFSLCRFFLVTKMIEALQRSTWTGWCQHNSYDCFRMTSRMASTCAWRSWAAEMVITLFNSAILMLFSFNVTCSPLHLGYQLMTTPNPLTSVSGSCRDNECHCENGHCVPANAHGVLCDGVNDCGDGSDEILTSGIFF